MSAQSITRTTFPTRTYLVWKKTVNIKDLQQQNMWHTAFGSVSTYAQEHQIPLTGSGVALYSHWDEAAGTTEIAIGNPVEGVTEVTDPALSLMTVPESPAVTITVHGAYDQLKDAHAAVKAYMAEHQFDEWLTVEDYLVTGVQAPDPKDWKTAIYSLYR